MHWSKLFFITVGICWIPLAASMNSWLQSSLAAQLLGITDNRRTPSFVQNVNSGTVATSFNENPSLGGPQGPASPTDPSLSGSSNVILQDPRQSAVSQPGLNQEMTFSGVSRSQGNRDPLGSGIGQLGLNQEMIFRGQSRSQGNRDPMEPAIDQPGQNREMIFPGRPGSLGNRDPVGSGIGQPGPNQEMIFTGQSGSQGNRDPTGPATGQSGLNQQMIFPGQPGLLGSRDPIGSGIGQSGPNQEMIFPGQPGSQGNRDPVGSGIGQPGPNQEMIFTGPSPAESNHATGVNPAGRATIRAELSRLRNVLQDRSAQQAFQGLNPASTRVSDVNDGLNPNTIPPQNIGLGGSSATSQQLVGVRRLRVRLPPPLMIRPGMVLAPSRLLPRGGTVSHVDDTDITVKSPGGIVTSVDGRDITKEMVI